MKFQFFIENTQLPLTLCFSLLTSDGVAQKIICRSSNLHAELTTVVEKTTDRSVRVLV